MCMIREPSFVRGLCILPPPPPLIDLVDLTNIDDEIIEISDDEQTMESGFIAYLDGRNMNNVDNGSNPGMAQGSSNEQIDQNTNAPSVSNVLETNNTDQPTEGREVEVNLQPPEVEIITVVVPR